MKMKYLPLLAALTLSVPAQAADIAVGLKAGTLGFGLEATTNVVPALLNVRLQGNMFNYNKTITDTSVRYDAKLKLRTVGLLADVYPFAGKFRLTGGAYYNGNKLSMTGTPTAAGNFTINNQSYSTAQVGTIKSTVKFNKFAPYIGLGWGDAISSGSPFGFSFELGALYMGQPKTTISTSNTVAGLAANIAAEKKKLDASLSKMKWYPVATVGLNWKF
ncbi:MAG: hypothetical protein Q9M14_02450 [Mariprofundaceae bacterium]|nr:hypothetical protein [Mariprofundaceae bacterium]